MRGEEICKGKYKIVDGKLFPLIFSGKKGSGTKALLSRLSNKMTKLAATEEKKDGERHNELITKIEQLSAKMDELQMTVENAVKAKQDGAHQEVRRSPRSHQQDDTDDGSGGSGGSGGSDPMEDPMYGFGSEMVSGTPPPRDPRSARFKDRPGLPRDPELSMLKRWIH